MCPRQCAARGIGIIIIGSKHNTRTPSMKSIQVCGADNDVQLAKQGLVYS